MGQHENLGRCGRLSGSHQGDSLKAADRRGVEMTLVANQPLRIPPSRFITRLQVSSGFDVADSEIAGGLKRGSGDNVGHSPRFTCA